MAEEKKRRKSSKKALDNFFEKPGRGRPGVCPSEIAGRAENFNLIFSQEWARLGSVLIQARTPEDVTSAFQSASPSYRDQFVPHLSAMIVMQLTDPKFPKREKAQIRFLADSLAGLGRISARRSRDICSEERAKTVHRIMRREYYVECSCGYSGPALRGACRNCGTSELDIGADWDNPFGDPL